MVEGIYCLQIFFPSRLHVKVPASFEFQQNGRIFIMNIVRHVSSLMINDLDNKIVNETSPPFQLLKSNIEVSSKTLASRSQDEQIVFHVLDYSQHNYKEIYSKNFTELSLLFESTKGADNIAIAQNALDYFIASYRIVFNDVLTLPLEKYTYVGRIYKEAFSFYTNAELKLPFDQRFKVNRTVTLKVKQVLFPFWNTDGKKFEVNSQENTQLLQTFFNNKTQPDPISEYHLKALEEFHIYKNYKYSFIESWTAIEIAITRYLKEVKISKGISKNKISSYETEVGISYLLNIELSLVHPMSNTQYFKDLVGKVDHIRKKRNKLIHENQIITEEIAKQALDAAVEIFNFLGYKRP